MELPATTRDITSNWLDHALHDNGFLGNAHIVSVNREPIGEGAGFLSDMARLTLMYERSDPALPNTIIAKLPTSHPWARFIAKALRLYEREIRFYNEIAPTCPIRTPQVVYSALDEAKERYVLLMEDCARYSSPDPDMEGMTYEQAKIVTLKIADFHARWWNSPRLHSFAWMPMPGAMESGPAVGRYKEMWADCLKTTEFLDLLPSGGLEAGNMICEARSSLAESTPVDRLTMIHCDLRADNMFFDWNTPDDPLILFDWSLASPARGVSDLSFLFGFSLATDLRREAERELLDLYLGSLRENGIGGYTREECRHDYLRGLLVRTDIPITTYTRADLSSARGRRVAGTIIRRWFAALVDNDAINALP